MNEKRKLPMLGQVFVPEFFIVAVVPHAYPGGFCICGSEGVQTSSSNKDGLLPCIGTDRKTAEEQYARACEKYEIYAELGTLVLIKFTDGIIDTMKEFKREKTLKGN